jgi:hypothetical protein
MENKTDFNEAVANQINSVIITSAISSELKVQDGGYQISILIEKIFEGEE